MALVNDMRTVAALLEAAEREAHAMGDELPGAEHLVLAALVDSDESGRVLLGVDADQFRHAVDTVHAEALKTIGLHPDTFPALPAVARGRVYRGEESLGEVLERARLLARQSRPQGLRTSHIIRAAAHREHGTTARAFDLLHVDRDSLQ